MSAASRAREEERKKMLKACIVQHFIRTDIYWCSSVGGTVEGQYCLPRWETARLWEESIVGERSATSGVWPNALRRVRNGSLCKRNFLSGKGAHFGKQNAQENLMRSGRNRNLV